MTEQELLSALEAIIYAADEPATLDQIVAAITGERPHAREAAPAEAPSEAAADAPQSASAEHLALPNAEAAASSEVSAEPSAATAEETHDASRAAARAESRAQVRAEIRSALDKLVASYAADERGIEIRKVAGGWKMYTKPQHHELVRRFIKALRPPLRLTMPALETLSVIAYKQPATLPEINEIRGVNCGGVVKTLLERRLITTAGRKDAVGRPILYRTSKDFLMRFGLADLDELPSLKEFEQLAQAALGADDGIAPIEPDEASANSPAEQGIAAGANSAATEAASTNEAASAPAPNSASPADSSQRIASSPAHPDTSTTGEADSQNHKAAPESKAAGSGA